jgi:hypothetical protein
MSLYLHLNPADPDSRCFLYHHPSHTLAEHFVTDTGDHFLRIHQDAPATDEALAAFTAWLQQSTGEASPGLTTAAGKLDPAALPAHIVFVAASGPAAALIHYPALGFTAGLREDGHKIPPHWRDPQAMTPEQRSHLLHQAADTLMLTLKHGI